MKFHATFIYAANEMGDRKELWDDIRRINSSMAGPWILMGDFNCVLSQNERMGGSTLTFADIKDFKECYDDCFFQDLKWSGCQYTWSNKQIGQNKIWSKLDRVLVNGDWVNYYDHAEVIFKPEGVFDHCPAVTYLHVSTRIGKTNFKYCDMWADDKDFRGIVQQGWKNNYHSNLLSNIQLKMRHLKALLKTLHKSKYGNLTQKIEVLRAQVYSVQEQMHNNPNDTTLQSDEKSKLQDLRIATMAYEKLLKQKSKAEWISLGDSNSAYFHAVIKQRRSRNRINYCIQNGERISDPIKVQQHFISYFKDMLGKAVDRQPINHEIAKHGHTLSIEQQLQLLAPVTHDEVKKAFFSIPNSKSAGPDGYSSGFFKSIWSMYGHEVSGAILSFFDNMQMPKGLNATAIALVPKNDNASCANEYRPIACCNVLYKVISKLLCNKLKTVLPSLIQGNQGAFVKGRSIAHNVLISQDLIRLYGRKKCSPRCLMKIDLIKAYDTVDWGFVHEILIAFGFPSKFCRWIMTCITTTTFSVMINRELCGYFKGGRGLRQGDPVSPLLFVMAMEYLTRTVQYNIKQNSGFRYHSLCKQAQLANLCFADDLLLFCKGDTTSVRVLYKSLEEFAATSGLNVNHLKSCIYTAGVNDDTQQQILQITGFAAGSFPMRYLGLPLSPIKWNKLDCQILIDKIVARIKCWSSRNLSYTGRCQLINSVLFSVQVYWASTFILPQHIVKKIESICRMFLWGQDKKRIPLVAWEKVCYPKAMGGLAIKKCKEWNMAAIGKYIWAVASKQDTLWVKWVHSIYLKHRRFWDYKPTSNCSWYWIKLNTLKQRFQDGYEYDDKWKNRKDGKYTIASGYNWLRGAGPKMYDARYIWCRAVIPKHSFIIWLAYNNRLLSKSRLINIGVTGIDGDCVLCALSTLAIYSESFHWDEKYVEMDREIYYK